MSSFVSFHCVALALPVLVTAQLSGTVGPLTSRAAKAAVQVCNILNYCGEASATYDNGAAILAAWTACIDGGEVYIPIGSYGLATWVTLSSGNAISINLEGIIYRTGTDDGNMILVESTTDFECYSGNFQGAIQGYGYEFAELDEYGPRLVRIQDCTDFSVHDFVLVDFDTGTNAEIYNMVVRGGNEGGLDGFDIWGTNIWVHDVEATNKDECVTVKSPASYILVENVLCNRSGGCAIGSLGVDTAIFNVEYDHVYSQNCNQMFMIKSNGGSGSVYNCQFNNFMGRTNAYTLDVNAYWTDETLAAGDGVEYYDLTFNHWHGTAADGETRASIQVLCPSEVPCYDITIENYYIWTDTGSEILYKCENAYGSGPCLNDGTSYTTYTTTYTVTTTSAST